MMTTIDVRL